VTPAHRADAGSGVSARVERLRRGWRQRWSQFRVDFSDREAQLRAELLPTEDDVAEATRRRDHTRTES